MNNFIQELDIDEEIKDELNELNMENYIGCLKK